MLKKLLKKYFPQIILKKASTIVSKYFDIYAIKSYSQEGEDMILKRLFDNQPNGFYVDVGAHHPKRFSNTYYFYKKGWRGINIDAMPDSMKEFKKIRSRDINLEKAISDKKQILTYFEFNEPALNGFSKELSESRDGLGQYKIISQEKMETSTLAEILDQYMPTKVEIDFLSIDIEGLDMSVLKANDWSKYKPKVILIEILGNSFESIMDNEITSFLKDRGYEVYAKCINTVIFKIIQSF